MVWLAVFSIFGALSAGASANLDDVSLGFSGCVKLGHWVPIRFSPKLAIDSDSYAITILDGDQSPVTYSGPLNDQGTGYVRFGKKFGDVRFEFLNDGEVKSTCRLKDVNTTNLSFENSTALLTVVLSQRDEMLSKLKSVIAAEAAGDETLTVKVSAASLLPHDAIGWRSVNRLIISPASVADLNDADPRLIEALVDWVKSGGDLILLGDPQQIELFQPGGNLASLIPGQIHQISQMKTSRDLERFVGTSRKQLIGRDDAPMPMLLIAPDGNSTIVAAAGKAPILVRSPKGFGRLSFCAINLEDDRLVQWPSHLGLIEKVIAANDQLTNQSARADPKRSTAGLAHSGYTDLLGQLRVPLDDFSTVRFLPFTLIAVLITLYILCVVVGDYFFLKNVLRKMELTWITFPLLVLLFCGLAWGISKTTRPSQLQVNQMEILDFGLSDGASQGTAWVNLYAPRGEKVDIDLASKTSFGLDIGQQIVSWQGLPGDGLGGMANEVSTGFKRLGYRQTLSHAPGGGMNVSLEQLPLQVASTKPLLIEYEISSPKNFSSQLSIKRDRLQGTFKNPLNVPVYNGKIFFGDYVYLLKKPLLPDVVTLIESAAQEKTLRSYLNRRAAKGGQGNDAGRSQNRPWDPHEKSLTRIADVMMFYQAAGGQGYTGLSNGYHRAIDFSRLLRLGQAVLVGQTETGSQIRVNGQEVSDHYDSNITMVRMVLPVTNN